MKQSILCLLMIFFFQGCVQKSDKNSIIPDKKETFNPFIGRWQSIKRFYPYKSYLIIKSDSTYHFEYGACIESGFSAGRWKMKDSIIVLRSDNIDSCLYLSHFGQDCVKIGSKHLIEKIITDCDPIDVAYYVQFDNEVFIIDNDTLKHRFKKEKLCPEIKNDFTRVIKIDTAMTVSAARAQ